MSGLAAIYHIDRSPVPEELLAAMLAAIAHRGPHGSGSWNGSFVALAQNSFQTTPESQREIQPLVSPEDGLVLILDGRIDNRTDLLRKLQSADDTDAALFLAAYRKWGPASLSEIIGDFAVIIWDPRQMRLFAARDIFGLRPLYYRTAGNRIYFASEPQQFFCDPSFQGTPNEAMIAEFLSGMLSNREETLYQDVHRLPPAHFLQVDAAGIRKECYWQLDPHKTIRYRTASEYGEHFLDLLREAILARSRCIGPLGAELSGGLDSTTICALVESLRREGRIQNDFETFSMVFPGRPCDETTFIDAACAHLGVKNHRSFPGPTYTGYAEEVSRHRDLPRFPNTAMQDGMKRTVASRGVRVLLNGAGGDEWFTGSPYHLADQLREFRLLDFMRATKEDLRIPAVSYPDHPVLRLGFWPLVPDSLKRAVRRLRGDRGYPAWIEESFAKRVGLVERLRLKDYSGLFPTIAQCEIFRGVNSPADLAVQEIEERSLALLGIEIRTPFNDRRIVEFAFAIPEEQHWKGRQTKVVLREATRGLLPEMIRTRDSKADFSHAFAETFRALEITKHLPEMEVSKTGWLKLDEILAVCRRIEDRYSKDDELFLQGIWDVWAVWSVGVWWAEHCKSRNLLAT